MFDMVSKSLQRVVTNWFPCQLHEKAARVSIV